MGRKSPTSRLSLVGCASTLLAFSDAKAETELVINQGGLFWRDKYSKMHRSSVTYKDGHGVLFDGSLALDGATSAIVLNSGKPDEVTLSANTMEALVNAKDTLSNAESSSLMSPLGPRQLFRATGRDQEFLVPSGVTELFVKMWGAGGAAGGIGDFSAASNGGGGGFTQCRLRVRPGEKLAVMVGQGGKQFGTEPAYGGGGYFTQSADLQYSGAGGGRSAIRRNGEDLMTAGGGGGGGATHSSELDGHGNAGGAGGGLLGQSGFALYDSDLLYAGIGGGQKFGEPVMYTGSAEEASYYWDVHYSSSGGYQEKPDKATAGKKYQGGSGAYGMYGGAGGGGYYGGGGGSAPNWWDPLDNSGGGGGSGFTGKCVLGTGQMITGDRRIPPNTGDVDHIYSTGMGGTRSRTNSGLQSQGNCNGQDGLVVVYSLISPDAGATGTASDLLVSGHRGDGVYELDYGKGPFKAYVIFRYDAAYVKILQYNGGKPLMSIEGAVEEGGMWMMEEVNLAAGKLSNDNVLSIQNMSGYGEMIWKGIQPRGKLFHGDRGTLGFFMRTGTKLETFGTKQKLQADYSLSLDTASDGSWDFTANYKNHSGSSCFSDEQWLADHSKFGEFSTISPGNSDASVCWSFKETHFKSSVGWFSGETPNMEEFVHTGEEDDDAFAVFLRG